MRRYIKATTEIIRLETRSPLLTGSVSMKPIKVGDIKVEDFADGFASEGGFKEINFD